MGSKDGLDRCLIGSVKYRNIVYNLIVKMEWKNRTQAKNDSILYEVLPRDLYCSRWIKWIVEDGP